MGRWERWKGNDMAKWERWESDEVGRWEVHGFIQGWGKQCESKIFFFFYGVNQGNEGDGLKFFLRARRDGKTFLRSSASC